VLQEAGILTHVLRACQFRDHLTDGAGDEIVFELPRGTYVPGIERVERDAENVATRNAEEDRHPRPAARSNRGIASLVLRPALAFVMGLTVAALVIAFSDLVPALFQADREQTTNRPTTKSTIFVMSFEPIGTSAETVSLARGLTEETIAVLSGFPELEVFPVSQAFVDSIEPSPNALQTDRLAYLSRGSTRIVGARLRIIAGLQDADDGRQIWSEQFEVEFAPERVFEIQRSIATNVARKLGEPFGVLRSSARRDLRDLHAPDLESYKCVLLAYEYRARFDAETHRRARDCLERATRNDLNYARAWALLAYLIVDEVRLFYDPRPHSLQRAVDAAERSVALDASDPLSHQALSVALFTAGQIEPAFAAARRAVELNPDNKEALWQLGFRYWLAGRHEDGVKLARRAIEESPSAPRWYHWITAAKFYRLGQYEHARSAA
jgi:TolB-like protein